MRIENDELYLCSIRGFEEEYQPAIELPGYELTNKIAHALQNYFYNECIITENSMTLIVYKKCDEVAFSINFR